MTHRRSSAYHALKISQICTLVINKSRGISYCATVSQTIPSFSQAGQLVALLGMAVNSPFCIILARIYAVGTLQEAKSFSPAWFIVYGVLACKTCLIQKRYRWIYQILQIQDSVLKASLNEYSVRINSQLEIAFSRNFRHIADNTRDSIPNR